MTAIRTKHAPDHFEPQSDDPQAQRRVRGMLEQIDYTAYASNKTVLGQVIGEVDSARVQKLAVAAAAARARWVSEALAIADQGSAGASGQVARLAEMRAAFLELTEAYEALRRMIERGYVAYKPPVTEARSSSD